MSIFRDTALAAVEAGICVVPPRQDGTKAPLEAWKQYQTERPTIEQIETWYSSPDRSGIGFVGGNVSGGLELFEFEGRAVDAGIVDRFIDLAEQQGLAELVNLIFTGYLEDSPSGGLHILYRCTETGCVKLAKAADGKDLIETKGEGGYMIVAPTNGKVHPTSSGWQLRAGGIDTIPTISPAQRRQLFNLAAEFDERPVAPQDEEPTAQPTLGMSGDGWVSQVITDYNARITWAEVLTGRFIELFTRSGVTYWHYDGAENHISATTNATGNDTLIVFSGTAQGAGWRIWEGHRKGTAPSYDRFSAHVLIATGSHNTTQRIEIAGKLQAAGYGPKRHDFSSITNNGETPNEPLPPDSDFWTARPELENVRTYAQAQMAAPWATLACVLARIICQVPPAVVLPDIINDEASLNLTLALVGRSGDGKGGSVAVARRAIDIGTPQFQIHTLGSGQGIAHGYGHWEAGKDGEPGGVVQHAVSVMFNVEEVDHLAAHNNQNASTALAELRRFCMGEKLGHLYADRTRRIEIPAHTYRGAIVVGVQPARAGVILNDSDGGTPQRFTWWPTIDHHPPDTEPERPEPFQWKLPPDLPQPNVFTGRRPIHVCQPVWNAVKEARRARNRGEGDPLDGHALLTRERIAAALGLLNGHWGITDEDWDLAGQAMTISDATRAGVAATIATNARIANTARAHAEADRDEVREDRQDQRVARRIVGHLRREGDWVTRNDLRSGLNSRDRQAFESAAAKLITAGQIEAEPIPQDDAASRPGTRYRVVDQ